MNKNKINKIVIDIENKPELKFAGAVEEWDLRLKAFEVAIRINPSILDDFIDQDEPFRLV